MLVTLARSWSPRLPQREKGLPGWGVFAKGSHSGVSVAADVGFGSWSQLVCRKAHCFHVRALQVTKTCKGLSVEGRDGQLSDPTQCLWTPLGARVLSTMTTIALFIQILRFATALSLDCLAVFWDSSVVSQWVWVRLVPLRNVGDGMAPMECLARFMQSSWQLQWHE